MLPDVLKNGQQCELREAALGAAAGPRPTQISRFRRKGGSEKPWQHVFHEHWAPVPLPFRTVCSILSHRKVSGGTEFGQPLRQRRTDCHSGCSASAGSLAKAAER